VQMGVVADRYPVGTSAVAAAAAAAAAAACDRSAWLGRPSHTSATCAARVAAMVSVLMSV
jgi:hypothetical protein